MENTARFFLAYSPYALKYFSHILRIHFQKRLYSLALLQNMIKSMCFSLSLNGLERDSKGFFFGLMVQNKILCVFLFCVMAQKGIPSIFIFQGMGRNEITKFRVLFFFCEMIRNGILNIFIFRGMAPIGIPSVFRSQSRRNSDKMNQYFRLFCVQRNNCFLRKLQP